VFDSSPLSVAVPKYFFPASFARAFNWADASGMEIIATTTAWRIERCILLCNFGSKEAIEERDLGKEREGKWDRVHTYSDDGQK